jgi:hypothetical protein
MVAALRDDIAAKLLECNGPQEAGIRPVNPRRPKRLS